ncbi:Acetate kinase [Pseudovibrio axinellae]|uniref:Acetate kinase n=1 Tax=Pseudovibrio axinellae TaxID=989403 RepID=A0A165XPJ9_9HYPH|nr:acetate/propionate family kinase [Pseudovibrio axinellae]KZL17919.1 Acetate kinase [Pseudovibrio axinellae]SER57859.1 acetate kinase [Pseudovibrio axinellae]
MSFYFTLNTGSSSVKFSLYKAHDKPEFYISGSIECLGPSAKLKMQTPIEQVRRELGPIDHASAVPAIFSALEPFLKGSSVVGIGHRIVHGGRSFFEPTELTPKVMDELEQLIPLAPLHQPYSLATIQAAKQVFPDALQIGCFDTAFHAGHSFPNDAFAIPRHFYEEGVRRYGFHGLSFDAICNEMRDRYSQVANERLVIAHLGNGASMCAVNNGHSISASTGFSAVDGLPMGTRCGRLDPGVMLYLMQEKKLSPEEIETIIYRRSGLLGLSGISSDMRDLEESNDPFAIEAIDYYCYQARREVATMAASLEGIDALIFSAGVGENSALVRSKICQPLAFLGITIDQKKNTVNAPEIGTGPVRVFIVATDEEQVIVRAVAQAHSKSQVS